MKDFKKLIKEKEAKIGIVGLGYVGIPVASLFASKGFEVIGFDIKKEKIEQINKGENPIEGKEPGLSELLKKVVQAGRLKATSKMKLLEKMDLILVMVETPIDSKNHLPQYLALKKASQEVGKNLKKGTLVIIESTIAPGTMDKVVKPILEENSHLKVAKDFFLVHCPERVMPGKLLKNLTTLDRVIGSVDKQGGEAAKLLYQNITSGKLNLTDCLTAELSKTIENAYRDTQIAFANEIALICEKLGIDFFKLKNLVYWPLLQAGAGVGGHCLPKDPWLLAHGVKDKLKTKLIPTSREINDFMPLHLADLTTQALKEAKLDFKKAKIVLMGLAYLENSDDTRNSPGAACYFALKKKGAKNLIAHDPLAKNYPGIKISHNLEEAISKADCLVFATAHSLYKRLDLKNLAKLMKTKIIVDGRNIFSKQKAEKLGFIYKGIGK